MGNRVSGARSGTPSRRSWDGTLPLVAGELLQVLVVEARLLRNRPFAEPIEPQVADGGARFRWSFGLGNRRLSASLR